MDIVILAIKNDLNSVLDTGRLMLTAFFIIAVFNSYVGILSKQVNWTDVIMRLVIGLVLLQNYTWVMDTTRDIATQLDQRINPEQSAIKQFAEMNDNMQKLYQQNTQRSFVSQLKAFFFGHLHMLMINLSFIFYAVISKVMEAIRYAIVGILYKLGPILVPLILFQSTDKVLKGWYTHYVSVLCWPILWHITLSIAVALSEEVGATGQGVEQFACLNFAVCFILLLTPMIVSSLVAGVGMGAVGSLAGLMATSAIYKVGREALHHTGKYFEPKFTQMPAHASASNTNNATFANGEFKKAVLRLPDKRKEQ